MDDREKQTRSKRIRHFIIVFVILLLVCSIGAVAIHVANQISVLTMSKQVAHLAETDHADSSSSQSVSQPPVSSVAVSSAPESMPEAVSEPASSSFVSKSSYSKPKDSNYSPKPAVPPMDPAIYQAMYPNLYAEKVQTVPAVGKAVYLTFDDGPSNLTIPLLNVLDQYKVKATFFVVGKTDSQSTEAMKEIVDRGHAIGVHSYTHRYQQIYATPAAFLDDFAKMHDLILNTTGVDTHIYRYAGGSVNAYNQNTARAIITEMNRRGYVYFDWNVSSGDAERGATARSIYSNTIREVHAHVQSVILFHNTEYKGNTLSQMAKIIETLQREGYHFETLDPSVDNRSYIFPVPSKK